MVVGSKWKKGRKKRITMSPLEALLLTQCQAAGLPTPERELAFHPKRRWRFDLAWPAPQLAVEIEGGTWVNGRHSRGKGFEQDCIKQAEALLAGWSLLRVTEGMVRDGRAVRLIERALEALWGAGKGEVESICRVTPPTAVRGAERA